MLRRAIIFTGFVSLFYNAEPALAAPLQELTEVITVVGAIVNKDSRTSQNGIVVFRNAKSGKTIPVGIGRAFVVEGTAISVLRVEGVEVTISDGSQTIVIDSETNQILSRNKNDEKSFEGDDVQVADASDSTEGASDRPKTIQSSTLVDKNYVNPSDGAANANATAEDIGEPSEDSADADVSSEGDESGDAYSGEAIDPTEE